MPSVPSSPPASSSSSSSATPLPHDPFPSAESAGGVGAGINAESQGEQNARNGQDIAQPPSTLGAQASSQPRGVVNFPSTSMQTEAPRRAGKHFSPSESCAQPAIVMQRTVINPYGCSSTTIYRQTSAIVTPSNACNLGGQQLLRQSQPTAWHSVPGPSILYHAAQVHHPWQQSPSLSLVPPSARLTTTAAAHPPCLPIPPHTALPSTSSSCHPLSLQNGMGNRLLEPGVQLQGNFKAPAMPATVWPSPLLQGTSTTALQQAQSMATSTLLSTPSAQLPKVHAAAFLPTPRQFPQLPAAAVAPLLSFPLPPPPPPHVQLLQQQQQQQRAHPFGAATAINLAAANCGMGTPSVALLPPHPPSLPMGGVPPVAYPPYVQGGPSKNIAAIIPINSNHPHPPPLVHNHRIYTQPPAIQLPPPPQLQAVAPIAAENPPPQPSTTSPPVVDVWNSAVSGWEQATLIKNKIGLRVGPHGRWQILQSIASGSYGAIFVAEDLFSLTTPRLRVAVKFDAACRDDHLKYEYEVYKSVLYNGGSSAKADEGFPQVHWYGHEYGHNILVMELLGAPVASLFAFCDRKFARRTVFALGEQMLKRIRHLHQRGFIHRDIKPENFLAGLGPVTESTCYLIDFGLARRYRFREGSDLKHIPFRKFRSFVGTAKYASLNSHKGYELSRRDDLESLGYVLVELVNGALPWRHISKKNQPTRHHASLRIKAMKEQTNWCEVCPSVAQFIHYCRNLPFSGEPDYEHLKELLKEVLRVEETPMVMSTVVTDGMPCNGNGGPAPADNLKCDSCMIRGQQSAHKDNHLLRATAAPEPVALSKASKSLLTLPTHATPFMKGDFTVKNVVKTNEDHAGGKTMAPDTTAAVTVIPPLLGIGNIVQHSAITPASFAIAAWSNPHGHVPQRRFYSGQAGTAVAGSLSPTSVRETRRSMGEDDSNVLAVALCTQCQERQREAAVERQKAVNTSDPNSGQVAGDTGAGDIPVTNDQHPVVNNSSRPGSLAKGNSSALSAEDGRPKPHERMCWQIWRDSTQERRFQYENKFSWTIVGQAVATSLATSPTGRMDSKAKVVAGVGDKGEQEHGQRQSLAAPSTQPPPSTTLLALSHGAAMGPMQANGVNAAAQWPQPLALTKLQPLFPPLRSSSSMPAMLG